MNSIDSFKPFVRELSPGMGTAVGERTILRKKSSGSWETWGDVAKRVSLGNSLLCPDAVDGVQEYQNLKHHISKVTLLMSGRHLQHGDETQPQKSEEIFTNCLEKSTRILTMEYGPIEIEKVADQTVTVIAGDGIPRSAKIHDHGIQEIYEITFRMVGSKGKLRHIVRATKDHRWKLRDGNITNAIKEGDIIATLPNVTSVDPNAIVHGLIFGDGSAHKSSNEEYRSGVSQGRTYADIRVCKQDIVRDEIVRILSESGYKVTYPKSSNGDPVFYIGKFEFSKEVPFCKDPDYIAGFIHGWWLADGSKTLDTKSIEISTANADAVEWLIEHCAYAGYSITSCRTVERTEGDGSFANGKPIHSIRLRRECEFIVESIIPVGMSNVYCPEEPVTGLFVLANGLLTGNCSTSATSFGKFLLLLSGSGVGRCYDDDMMLIDWDNAPNLRCILSHEHKDFDWSSHESVRDAEHKYGHGRNVIWHEVADSREGWAKALEIWEVMAFEKIHREKTLVLDFSQVRCKGSLIGGMQNRPASGPVALMNAFNKAASLKGCGLDPWRQTLYIDHYFSECVLVGGARRCLPENTIVTLVTGSKKIQDVIVGDIISTAKGQHKVTSVFDQGVQDTILIRHQFGVFECTPNHQMAVFTSCHDWQFKQANELVDGDRLVFDPQGWDYQEEVALPDWVKTEKQCSIHNTTGIDIKIPTLDEDIAWLLGLIAGNGHIGMMTDGHGRVQISTHTDYVCIAERAESVLRRFGVNVKVINHQPRENTLRVTAHSVQLATYLNQNFKQSSTTLRIPDYIMRAPRNIRWAFIAGLFDADGSSKTRPLNLCCTVYSEFALDLQLLCLSLGVIAHVKKITPENIDWQPKFNVNVKGMENLKVVLEQFDDMSEKCNYSSSYSHDGFSFPTAMVRKEYKGHWVVASDNQTTHRMTNRGDIKFSAFPVRVLGIERGRSIKTYDLEIQDIHQFTANGFVVHNSARMSTKIYTDPSIFEFITVKRPIEFIGKTVDEILAIRQNYIENKINPPMGFLWSSNNSIAVDAEFWRLLELKRDTEEFSGDKAKHVRRVFKLATEASYADGTGEPGFLNVDRFTRNDSGWEELTKGDYVGSPKYQVEEDTQLLLSRIARKARRKQYWMITNPCGEICLSVLAGFCTIADCVPFHADSLDEAEDAFRVATRALIRVNLMDSIYRKEVDRTNRIGVGITGVHEFAWKFFRVGFRDLINPDFDSFFRYTNHGHSPQSFINDILRQLNYTSGEQPFPGLRAAAFWMTLARFNRAVRDESISYSKQLGVTVPHTCTTIKPSGSVSKLFGLTEGWHLPPLAFMLRWVQFRHDDPLVEQYKKARYPWRELTQYTGTVIIGFPTAPTIANLGMGNNLVLAGDASPEEQYKWLMLGEKYWINGVDEYGNDVKESYGNQISYTLKFNPNEVDYKHFRDMLIKYQSQIKACAVMPQANNVAYEYVPEEAITKARFEEVAFNIQKVLSEDLGREHLNCDTGGCPIDFNEGDKEIVPILPHMNGEAHLSSS